MDQKNELTQALKEALKAKDELKKRVLRMALAAIKNAEIDKGEALDDPTILGILQKEVKTRHETIEGAELANRPDLISEAQAEIDYLETFLPQPLTTEEVETLAREAIAEVGATTPREMGMVMKILMPRVKGRADGKEVSLIVRQLLGQ
jgi:uncharacterized protein YqeY